MNRLARYDGYVDGGVTPSGILVFRPRLPGNGKDRVCIPSVMPRARPGPLVRRLATSSTDLIVVGGYVLRCGLVLLILWFGVFKFTDAEARAIQPLIEQSPLVSWLYQLTDVRGVSRTVGIVEIAIGLMIALRPFSSSLSAIGSLAAVGMFVTTLSFLVTTPGMWAWVEGYLVPSDAGAFLIKDILLLGAALWTAGEALSAKPRHGT